MALKYNRTRTAINQISRLSKKLHEPVFEPVSKRFVAMALNDKIDQNVLDGISVRDKFKYLNLLAYKSMHSDMDAFIIRNGKIHIEKGRKVYTAEDIARVYQSVLTSLGKDFEYLKDKKILLDKDIKYGLPVSRKQTVGNLPFGSTVDIGEDEISAGIYWEDEWGARDLDLSTIDPDGNRTGWGAYSGYSRENPITFSGDITSAPYGAMEFMVSKGQTYGLFVNIYSGNAGCGMEVVVGTNGNAREHWIENVKVREKTVLPSRSNIVGFVKGDKFVFWQGRWGGSSVSRGGKQNPVVARGMADFWTVTDLLNHLKIDYDVDRDEDTVYDYDLTYGGFSYDKLENLLLESQK